MPSFRELIPVRFNDRKYLPTKSPRRDDLGRTTYEHAPEVTYDAASDLWETTNWLMNDSFDRRNFHIAVLESEGTVTQNLPRFLDNSLLNPYPVATYTETSFPEGDLDVRILKESPRPSHVYIVASIQKPVDIYRANLMAEYYTTVLGAECATLVASYITGLRQDKNVDKEGKPRNNPLNTDAVIGMLAPFFDRYICLEPHSSAAQSLAMVRHNRPLAPLSPWMNMVDKPIREGVTVVEKNGVMRYEFNHDNTIIIRPDKGRNIAGCRIEDFYGFPGIALKKIRLSDKEVIYILPEGLEEILRGKVAIAYDDLGSTFSTLGGIAKAMEGYGAEALFAFIVHGQFTENWQENIAPSVLKKIYVADTVKPLGDIAGHPKIERVSLTQTLRDLIEADVNSVNFWRDPNFSHMILQPQNHNEEAE